MISHHLAVCRVNSTPGKSMFSKKKALAVFPPQQPRPWSRCHHVSVPTYLHFSSFYVYWLLTLVELKDHSVLPNISRWGMWWVMSNSQVCTERHISQYRECSGYLCTEIPMQDATWQCVRWQVRMTTEWKDQDNRTECTVCFTYDSMINVELFSLTLFIKNIHSLHMFNMAKLKHTYVNQ